MNKWIYKIDNVSLRNKDCIQLESVFHNANGYIGVRSNFEEGYPTEYDTIRGTYINGFYDIAEMKQAEKLYGLTAEKQTMLNIGDTQSIFLDIDGEKFSMFHGVVLESYRLLNMKEGYTERKIVWRSPKGKEVEIRMRRMTSFVQLSLFTIEYSVKALNFKGKINFVSSHTSDVRNYCDPNDPRNAGECLEHLIPIRTEIIDGVSFIRTSTKNSKLQVCSAVKNQMSKPSQIYFEKDHHTVITNLETSIEEKETVTLTKWSVFTDSLRRKNCKEAAKREMRRALSKPLTAHYAAQGKYVTDYWNHSLLDIEGDDDLSMAVRFNLYQLIQSVGKDEYCSVAAKGLSGEGYEGHYFWDTEMYIQPFFILTNPGIAKKLIEYRYATLEPAKENARILGHKKGALYPWRTIMGKECSGYFPSGSAQYHIDADISYAVVEYYLATKDVDFIAQKGAEILFETARLWMDVGNYEKGKFHINEVTGPDEYTCMVNDNYFTNAGAKANLTWAVKFYELLKNAGLLEHVKEKIRLSEEEVKAFEQAAEHMYLPYDKELGINPQDDSFLKKEKWDLEAIPREKFPLLLHYHPLYLYRHQVCKQADTVLAHFIYEDAQSLDTIRRSFDYYKKITTHDSSLSTCIFSIVATKLGYEDKAYEYFGDSAKLDLFNTHQNTKDGIHTANMGGNYMAVVYGFSGLRLKEQGIFFEPSLPRKWSSYRYRIFYEGSQIEVEEKKNVCIFRLISGEKKEIHVYGRKYILEETLRVSKYKAVILDLDSVIYHTDKKDTSCRFMSDEMGTSFDEEINDRLRGVRTMQVSKEVINTLTALKNCGLKLAIGSSNKNVTFLLKQMGLEDFFDEISDGTGLSASKPYPEVFLKASEMLQLKPSSCLVVEEANAGLDAAFAGGMDCAAIGDAVKSNQATYNLGKISDLLEIFKNK